MGILFSANKYMCNVNVARYLLPGRQTDCWEKRGFSIPYCDTSRSARSILCNVWPCNRTWRPHWQWSARNPWEKNENIQNVNVTTVFSKRITHLYFSIDTSSPLMSFTVKSYTDWAFFQFSDILSALVLWLLFCNRYKRLIEGGKMSRER